MINGDEYIGKERKFPAALMASFSAKFKYGPARVSRLSRTVSSHASQEQIVNQLQERPIVLL
jgi:hypothetical protein